MRMIYEPEHHGHHFAYLAHILPEMCELADVTLGTTPSAMTSRQFQLHLASSASRLATIGITLCSAITVMA